MKWDSSFAMIVLLGFICVSMSACAGSGSSGFDARADAEQRAISKVGAEGGCEDVEGTIICAPESDLTTALDLINPNVSIFENTASVSIDPISGATVSCLQSLDLQTCQLEVRVQTSAFKTGTQFFVTTHFKNESFWSNPLILTQASLLDSELSAFVTLKSRSILEASSLQIAILLYGENTPSLENQGQVPLLSDFFPSIVYVVSKLKPEISPGS
ncbi:hypothetical protein JYT17_00225 [Nitrospira defluvii]|nr:hypothetical protein [Nitrospira defluvii]